MTRLYKTVSAEQLMQRLADSLKAHQAEWQAQGIEVETAPAIQCEICCDRGWITYEVHYEDPRFGKAFPCPNPNCATGNAGRQRAWENRLKTARVPELYKHLSFETWESLPDADKRDKWLAYAACRLFVERPDHAFTMGDVASYLRLHMTGVERDVPRNSIMLHGPVGTGKTGLVVAALNALISNGKSVLYSRAQDLIREVQRRYGQSEAPSSDDVLDTFRDAPILVVDECNLPSKPKDDTLRIMESVMRHRFNNGLPTLITSNVGQEEFVDMWEERTGDVVKTAHWIFVGGTKLRKTSQPLSDRPNH